MSSWFGSTEWGNQDGNITKWFFLAGYENFGALIALSSEMGAKDSIVYCS
jgi:hypothetical protein